MRIRFIASARFHSETVAPVAEDRSSFGDLLHDEVGRHDIPFPLQVVIHHHPAEGWIVGVDMCRNPQILHSGTKVTGQFFDGEHRSVVGLSFLTGVHLLRHRPFVKNGALLSSWGQR